MEKYWHALGELGLAIAQKLAGKLEPARNGLELVRLEGGDPTTQQHLREAHRLYAEMRAAGHAQRLARGHGS